VPRSSDFTTRRKRSVSEYYHSFGTLVVVRFSDHHADTGARDRRRTDRRYRIFGGAVS
jgi:hypothetical protein